jgi:hypothetical protein
VIAQRERAQLNRWAAVNEVYHITSTALFLAVSPLLVAVRFMKPKRMPWWLLVILAAVLGWLFSNSAVYFYYENLSDRLAAAGGVNGAPQDLIDRWQSDGAKRVFAYLFGWLYGLVYLVPWLVIYFLGVTARKATAKRSAAAG